MPNMKTVARAAGVSASTVSRVLSGRDGVRESTRRRVLQAVQQLDYTPNSLAKSLKLGCARTIAFLVSNMQNQMFPPIAQGVSDTARKRGYSVLLCIAGEDAQVEGEYIQKLRRHWVDGFLVASMLPDSRHIHKLREDGIPVELLLRHYDDSISAVVIDNYKAARHGVEHLIRTGHRRIAICCGPRTLPLYRQRHRAWRDALEDHGLSPPPGGEMESEATAAAYRQTLEMLDRGGRPDAVFATTDARAIQIMRALRDRGLRIPRDVSVLGFDDIEVSACLDPPLATVRQPFYKMGSLAVSRLIDSIEGRGPERPVIDVMETRLMLRGSVRTAPETPKGESPCKRPPSSPAEAGALVSPSPGGWEGTDTGL